MTLVIDIPTISEECQLCMHVDNVENILYDSYIVEFDYDPTCNYFDRWKCELISNNLFSPASLKS